MSRHHVLDADTGVPTFGTGPPVILVHGSVIPGPLAWTEQMPLAQRWTLLMPYRHGYDPDSPPAGEDFDTDAAIIAGLLGDGAHLVGFSYGAVAAALAAARRPEAVSSLTLIEPPAFAVVPRHPAVPTLDASIRRLCASGPVDDSEFLREFIALVGARAELPDPLPPVLVRAAATVRAARQPGDAQIPLDRLGAAGIPSLVVTGGHSPAFDAISDEIARRIGAGRSEIRGHGHLVTAAGEPLNACIETMLRTAQPRATSTGLAHRPPCEAAPRSSS